jgi:hypothetical protein
MAIYNILETIEDVRKGSDACEFNGYLEDYLETIEKEGEMFNILSELFELNNDLKIIVNLKMGISKESISNQIIRYKDVFKLKGEPVKCGTIVYVKDDENERALLLTEDDYILAKGIYYSMTEPYNRFQEAKNDFVAMSIKDPEHVKSVFNRLFTYRAGALQREIDRKNYPTYEEAKLKALEISEELKSTVIEKLTSVEEIQQEEIIYDHIVKWFLLKKYLYVQYMVNKDILKNDHEGNVKRQRNQAKKNADEIAFISFSEMWKATMDYNYDDIKPVEEPVGDVE